MRFRHIIRKEDPYDMRRKLAKVFLLVLVIVMADILIPGGAARSELLLHSVVFLVAATIIMLK